MKEESKTKAPVKKPAAVAKKVTSDKGHVTGRATAKTGSTAAKAPAKKPTAAAKAPAKKPGAAALKPLTQRAKKVKGPTIAAFIDIENANASRDNVLEIFEKLKSKGAVTYGKLYGFRFEKAADYDEIVTENRLETVGRMRFKHGDDSVVDTRLVVDTIIAAESRKFDNIFVWAGVGDLMSLFAHVKQMGCKVITVDLPVFDCANKFVDNKLKLFSPHTLSKPAPVAAAPVAAYSAAATAAPAAQKFSAKPVTQVGGDSFGAIADDDNQLEDLDLEDLDELDLDDLEDIEDDDEDNLNYADNNEDIDDFDDLGDNVSGAVDVGAGGETLSAKENAKLLALSQQLLRDLKEGKEFNAKEAAKALPDDIGEEGSKHSYYSAGTEYAAESSDEAKSDAEKPESDGQDDFGNFGKL